MFSVNEIIDLAIQIERNGEALCRKIIQKDNMEPVLVSLLEWMAEQEAQHVKWFTALKGNAGITVKDSELEQVGKTLPA